MPPQDTFIRFHMNCMDERIYFISSRINPNTNKPNPTTKITNEMKNIVKCSINAFIRTQRDTLCNHKNTRKRRYEFLSNEIKYRWVHLIDTDHNESCDKKVLCISNESNVYLSRARWFESEFYYFKFIILENFQLIDLCFPTKLFSLIYCVIAKFQNDSMRPHLMAKSFVIHQFVVETAGQK